MATLVRAAAGDDIVHQDVDAPKIPGCSNDFMLEEVVKKTKSVGKLKQEAENCL